MSVSLNPSPNYKYLSLEFKVSRSLLKTAMINLDSYRFTIVKVICYSIFIFSMIAIFEALVINGTRLALNAGIWLINTCDYLFFTQTPSEQETIPVIPLLPDNIDLVIENDGIFDEPLPLFEPGVKDQFLGVFNTLANSNYFTLAFEQRRLEQFREDTKHIHPLQVLGYMLEKNSEQKRYAAKFFKKTLIQKSFIRDTLAGFDHPIHSTKTIQYIAAFAAKIEIPQTIVQRFLLQNPPHLKDFINYALTEE